MATRGMNTMTEGLQKLAQDITALKMTPDADVAFLIGLETTILSKLREQFDSAAGQMPPPPGNAMEAAGAADMGAGAALMGAGAAAGGPPMGAPGPGGPMPTPPGVRFAPDQLRQAFAGGVPQGG